jgi:hypothetical protein
VACGKLLPDAPMPASPAPEAPFLLLDWGGGRELRGVERRLAYRPDATTAPFSVELGKLHANSLGRRFLIEALAVVPLAAVLGILVPSLQPVTMTLSFLALLVALLWRRYFLVLRWLNGGSTRWPLGVARMGSEKARRIDGVWSSAAPSLAAKGLTVLKGPGPFGPRA